MGGANFSLSGRCARPAHAALVRPGMDAAAVLSHHARPAVDDGLTMFRVLIAALCLSLASLVCAQDMDLYEAAVDVPGQDEASRAAALPAALAGVLLRLTGDPTVTTDPALRDELAKAAQWLQTYRYQQEADPSGTPRTLLIARFDRAAVDELVSRSGRRHWPTPRPTPVVWLAIDDGRGARLLSSAQASVVAPLTRRAEQRGLRLTYPLLDLEEQQKVAVTPLWNGDSSAARAASRRYQSRVALIGKLYRSGAGWRAEWQVWDGDTRLAEAAPSADSALTVLAAGADLVADALAARYVEQIASAGPAGRYAIWIEGIRSAEDYARVLAYLGRLSVVRQVEPQRVVRDRLRLELDLATGVEGLARLVAAEDVLVPAQAGDPRERVFQLQP